MLKIEMTRGLQGSGKTKWAKEKVAANPGRYKRVNKDDLRAMMDCSHWSKDNEAFVIRMRDLMIQEALDHGKHVIVDDTNGHPKHELRLREIAEHWSKFTGSLSNPKRRVEVEVVDFTHVPIEQCIKNDLNRLNSVGEKVIRDTYKKFFAPPPPEKVAHDLCLHNIVICDIDGTVALMNGRGPYEGDKVDTDLPNVPITCLVNYLITTKYEVIFVSGRSEDYRDKTQNWLNHHITGRPKLFMRPSGDNRNDAIIKREIYEREIKGKYNVMFILDDRNRVVEEWRRLGLTCLQVADGDF